MSSLKYVSADTYQIHSNQFLQLLKDQHQLPLSSHSASATPQLLTLKRYSKDR